MTLRTNAELPYVTARLAYLGASDGPIAHWVYPVNSGRQTIRPPIDYRQMRIHDSRSRAAELDLDSEGFTLHR